MTAPPKYKSKYDFYKQFAILSVPIILQQLVGISLNFIDNIMVGQLGIKEIAAVGFANKHFFIFILAVFGSFGGMQIFMAQFFGNKDYQMVRKIFALSICVAIIISTLFFISGYFTPYFIISLFSQDETVLIMGSNYLKIISISFPFTAISFAIMTAMRSMGNTQQALYVTIIITSINTFLNYCLIYGNLGFPRLETDGAAIATTFARIIETLCFLYLFTQNKYHLIAKFKTYWGIKMDMVISIVKISIPVFFTEIIWVLGTTALAIAYAKLGTEAAAAAQISELLISFGTIIFMGVATGASIMVAQTLGRGGMNEALHISGKVLEIAFIAASILVGLSLLLIKPILYVYNLEDAMVDMTTKTLIVMSFALFFKMINWTILVGIIRAGGDTKVAFLIDTLPLILYAVPIAFITALFTDLNIYTIVFLVNLEEVAKMVIAIYRFKSKKWINNLTEAKPHT